MQNRRTTPALIAKAIRAVENSGLEVNTVEVHSGGSVRILTQTKTGRRPCLYTRPLSMVLMIGLGGRIGGQLMPRVQLPAVTPKHRASNKGRIIGQKLALLPRHVWAIRARVELAGNLSVVAAGCV